MIVEQQQAQTDGGGVEPAVVAVELDAGLERGPTCEREPSPLDFFKYGQRVAPMYSNRLMCRLVILSEIRMFFVE